MALNGIFGNGLSGLQAAQQGLRVVSQNIANVNTPGYVRTELELAARQTGFESGGVEVTGVRRAADQFLAAAALSATAGQGAAAARADLLDRAQALFGDPTGEGSLFADIDRVFTRFTELSSDPSNALRRSSAVQAVKDLLASFSRAGEALDQLRVEADARIAEQVGQVNSLMSRIADLNTQIQRTRGAGGDPTSAENAQSGLIDQLAAFIDIKVNARDAGGVDIRTAAGALLVHDEAVTLSYTPAATAYETSDGISLIDRNGASHPLAGLIRGGSLGGLLQAREQDLGQISEALGALAGAAADALNAAHNESTAVPAPASLTGRQTGLLSSDRLNFTGETTIGVVDSTGALTHRVEIDFDARTITVDGGSPVVYGPATATISQFVTTLDAAMTGFADISFTNGQLTLSAASGGIAIQQDAADPSGRAGRGFSHFFGLNDLVTRDTPAFFETGINSAETHGLNAGGAVDLRVTDSTGRVVLERSVTVTGTTWAQMITALNASGTGLGGYGSFALDAQGRLVATPASGYRIDVTGDTTTRASTGVSMSALFGLDREAVVGRALELAVPASIADDPMRLALARPDLSQTLTTQVLETGDNRGALALAAARDVARTFPAAGALPAQTATLAAYASRLGGEAGRRAEDAARGQASAEAVLSAAVERRSSVEGVSLDDELVKMTQYQQSYAAASRLIQAASEMFDTLLSIR